MSKIELSDLGRYLPPYLSGAERQKLFSEVRKFPNNHDIYTASSDPDPLQADIWPCLHVVNWHTGEKKQTRAIVISNSCDLSSAPNDDLARKVVFAPLVDLGRYLDLLRANGRSEENIKNIETLIKRQEVARVLFLPSPNTALPDSIALLDDLHSQPLEELTRAKTTRLVSLNQYGWYIFLIKLSIHFTRLGEGFSRANPIEP
jgi:hypothetical protein